MLQGLRTFYLKRVLRRMIEGATKTIYSEAFEFAPLVARLSHGQGGVRQLRAYVAIQVAARLGEPLRDTDVEVALNAVLIGESHAKWPVFKEILSVHHELAAHYLSLRHVAILKGKLALKNDEYSFDGTLYRLARETLGPVSRAKYERLEKICKEMHDLNRRIEKAELNALEKCDEQEFHRASDEMDVRELRDEWDALEEESLREESAKVVALLEDKLRRLVQDKN